MWASRPEGGRHAEVALRPATAGQDGGTAGPAAGRQSARAIHFLCAFSFFGFFVAHIAMVILSGSWNNLRSMITGWYVIKGRGRD